MIKCMCLVQVHFGLFIFGSINFYIFMMYGMMKCMCLVKMHFEMFLFIQFQASFFRTKIV